ncbi:DsbC/DsbD-like thiol-disulfide interchange protein/cytochrome c biogenesis protein CcdA [Sphingobium sp. B2D3A]|uniref:protein-disulfide reductase DsbD family protein n=1 Tax=unclassified Sphingobium TaxID=2611147 RepID=UPI00222454DC|nr:MULTISPECIES: thioredoxin family protein [unclassified Sphingobium]MCW2337541.1 DsbC/DsbD-like thiol-disulfide interchange protein/cytochrome c biogenesis protein CcdA [Sphingobium sp. B2D3A]MCW2383999.1 DsbC/DsbD-like thiol-disulfide interchange protein/cytochrome c biogenesis protein CcdA [Sphingobium sp. B2D3D]
MAFPVRRLNGVLMTLGVLLAALLVGPAAFAQSAAPADGGAFGQRGAPNITASLIAETDRPAAGSTVTLAIVMKPKAGWHGYWGNPGDAGQGMQVAWDLPTGTGLKIGDFRYPVPDRLLIAGLMNHVYEHDYAVLVDLAVPAGLSAGTVLPVRGKARWLACTDAICVPEQGEIATTLTIGDGATTAASRKVFDGFRAALPRPLDQPARYAVAGGTLSIAVPYPQAAPMGAPWFFATTQDVVRYAQPQTVRRAGDWLVVEVGLAEDASVPAAVEGVLAVSPGVALAIRATPGAVPEGGERLTVAPDGATTAQPAAKTGLGAVLLILGGAFLGGLILNVMPCVFPILSLKAISLAKAGGDERQARRDALAYTAGILVTCLALGALMLAIRAGGTQVGWAFQLQDPRVIAVLLMLMVAITLNLLGGFEIASLSVGQGRAGQGGQAGAFWTGALAAFVATPCTGPFMGAAMGAALVLPWPLALAVFAGLGLGLASPFIAIAWVPGLRRLMPRPGAWMTRFRRIMAVPMGLTALALLWLLSRQLGAGGVLLGVLLAGGVILALLLLGRRQRAGGGVNWALGGLVAVLLSGAAIAAPALVRGDRPVAGEGLVGEPFSEARLAALRAQNKPVFLYFTADWCLTCKVNEANAIDTQAVREAFEAGGVAPMVGDWTNADPAISRFLEAHGRSGVPLYLFYAPGAATPQVLPQVLTSGTLTALAKR